MTSLASRTPEELRAILDAHPGGIVEVAADGAILMANAEACRFLGLSFDELAKRYVPDWGTETLREDGSTCPVEEYPVSICLRTGRPAPAKTIGVRQRDGVVHWGVFRAVPLTHAASGALQGAMVMFCDISDRVRVETDLLESERLLHLVLDQIPAILWTTDVDLVIKMSLGAGLKNLGRTAMSNRGQTMQEAVGSNDPEYLPIAASRRALQGESVAYTLNFLGRDFQSHIEPLRGKGGEIIGTIGVAFDVTERVRAEDERDKLLAQERIDREKAEVAVKARDIFLSIASHELRTPLAALQLQTEGTLRYISRLDPPVDVSKRLNHLMEISVRQVQRLTHLIDQLLDVSRISAGGLDLRAEPGIDLAALTRESLERMREVFARADCTFSTEIAQEVSGRWDRLRLDQVITNLLSNAAKYGPGKPVHVRVAREGNEAIFEVRDEGVGIPESEREIIFDRFERAGAAQHVGGLGLGLYITREIVRAHGGSIEVRSAPGSGSTFVVRLPLSSGPAHPP
jgi:PAS domain S-box-containing protein